VAIIHNLPSPYRLQLFEHLRGDVDLEIRLFFTGRPKSNRPYWKADSHRDDPWITYLPEISLPLRGRSVDRVNINFEIGRIFEWKPDVLLLYGYTDVTNLVAEAICLVRKIPFILCAEISHDWPSTVAGRIYKPMAGLVIRKATCLAPGSKSCADFFTRLGAKPKGMRIVPPVPDVEALAARSDQLRGKSDEIRRKFQLEHRFVVLFVGRLVDSKGISELFEALGTVVKKDPKVTLAVVGNGPMEGFVRDRCAFYPQNSVFLGSVDDETLLELFVASDLHIMPSWSEAYGVVSAESLACGVPSVVTRTSGCSDLIVDGVNGFLIEPRKPEAIADSILKVSLNPALHARMKESARTGLKGLTMADLHRSLKELITLATSE
jgi:glycosyltransferase involved in cell wall biosynthesis